MRDEMKDRDGSVFGFGVGTLWEGWFEDDDSYIRRRGEACM